MKITRKNYYVLFCDDSKYNKKFDLAEDGLVYGVYSSLREARNVGKDIKDCLCKHYIKRCSLLELTVDSKAYKI